MAREAKCPNCGGPIEFKLGSAAAMVCPYCRHSVLRTDRDLRSLGKIADLVPTSPEMVVGDMGLVNGDEFVVGGRTQLDHGQGPWDEWYIELTRTRQWAWLAKAQGKWYLTYPVQSSGLPPWESLTVGLQGHLPGIDVPLTVAERGGSALISAEGELPFPAVPGDSGRYVDLVGPQGRFATVDYGDGTAPPQLYAGYEIPRNALTFTKSGLGPRPVERVQAERLRCPTCGAPVPIFVPESTERAACQSCSSLLNYSNGNLSFLKQLEQEHKTPAIPLGTVGTFGGVEHTVIGYVERSTSDELLSIAKWSTGSGDEDEDEDEDDDDYEKKLARVLKRPKAALHFVQPGHGTYTWREYLLHTQDGYRWLVEDNGHFTYVEPASAGDITYAGGEPTYQGTSFKPFSKAVAVVTYVLGEFYWKVERGEAVRADDYIAPPLMLSQEGTAKESIWSLGRYMPAVDVWRALGLEGSPPRQRGVGAAQPNDRSVRPAAIFTAIFLVLLGGVYGALTMREGKTVKLLDHSIAMPVSPDETLALRARRAGGMAPNFMPQLATAPTFSEPFVVPPKNHGVEVTLRSSLRDEWVGVAMALIEEKTGTAREWAMELDSFNSGSTTTPALVTKTDRLGQLPPGRYTLRLDPRWASNGTDPRTAPSASLTVRTASLSDAGSTCCCTGAGFLLLLPLLLAWIRRRQFESTRQENSNL